MDGVGVDNDGTRGSGVEGRSFALLCMWKSMGEVDFVLYPAANRCGGWGCFWGWDMVGL